MVLFEGGGRRVHGMMRLLCLDLFFWEVFFVGKRVFHGLRLTGVKGFMGVEGFMG